VTGSNLFTLHDPTVQTVGFRDGAMEPVGRLAAGIAHECNNLLTVINGCTELALENDNVDDEMRDLLQNTIRAGARAATLIHQLLAFAQRQLLQMGTVDLNALVTAITPKLRRFTGDEILLKGLLLATPVRVMCDRHQIEQVIIHLVANACDAMTSGGILTITVHQTTISEPHETCSALKPRPYGTISISDTGHGIPEGVRPHIFEPFFTTTPIGQASGLGLAAVYGILKQSGGFVNVDSHVDRGVTFTCICRAPTPDC
jgi:two-component system, cell cycle sensor histidine kinase and response regulator CckA